MKPLVVISVGAVLVGLAAFSMLGGASASPDPLAKPVRAAEQDLERWLNTFPSQTSAEVRRTFGEPSRLDEWLYEDEKQLIEAFRLSEQSELALYYYDGKVIKASFHMLSE